MQADGSSEQIKGTYLTQISEDGEHAVLSGSNQYSVSDKVIRGGVKIQKRDLETKDTKAQGSATLQYTEFNIISLNDSPVLVEGKLYSKNETVKKIQTGIDGIASTSADLLPYGNYRLEESKAPEGYLTDGTKAIDFSITEDGKIVDLTDKSHSVYNQIKRGDIEGVKIGAGTHKRLAGVPFRITSKTTGESHIVVTDKNGQFSTASSWASHKVNTNAGKSSEDGVWFGTSEPDDSKGALLYDTYVIEELKCDSNAGFKLIPAFEVVVSRNKVTVNLGTLTDEYEKEITIHTTATDKKTGEKMIVAGKDIKIVDKVTLDGLEVGTKYKLSGWQMLKEENAELLIDGKCVDSNYTFTADSEKMVVEITYSFDGSALGGQNLVTFEELYDMSNPKEPVKVAEHKDINDDGQTVLITERIIKIHTTATDKDGKKEIEAGKDVTIVDKVTLDGLEVGTKYKLSGWQMLKEENAELLIDGKKVSNDYEFIADNEKMTVEIAFTFDGSSLGGKNLVTFEELYDMTNPNEGGLFMSKHHIEKVTCPSCHHEGDFEVWDSINTVLDPAMKEKVLNQSIFLYTCPNCGETFRLNYPTLYHQMEDLVMIYLVPESEVEKTYEMFYGENALADYRTEKYLYRIVTSANQLVEKIQIFDAGKDDRVMELVKLLATDSILKNDPDIEFDELRFAVDDDGTNILVIINKGEITGAVDIDNMYEFASSHCNDFKDLRDDDEIVINREWILNKLAEAENE